MILVLQIGLGIVFGVFLLGIIATVIGRIAGHIADNREWKARQRAFARRYKRAESLGWIYNADKVTPLEDQLQQWEREYAAQAQTEAGQTRTAQAVHRYGPRSGRGPAEREL